MIACDVSTVAMFLNISLFVSVSAYVFVFVFASAFGCVFVFVSGPVFAAKSEVLPQLTRSASSRHQICDVTICSPTTIIMTTPMRPPTTTIIKTTPTNQPMGILYQTPPNLSICRCIGASSWCPVGSLDFQSNFSQIFASIYEGSVS